MCGYPWFRSEIASLLAGTHTSSNTTLAPLLQMRVSVLSDALNNIVNAEKRGKRQVLVRPSSKVILRVLTVMQKHGEHPNRVRPVCNHLQLTRAFTRTGYVDEFEEIVSRVDSCPCGNADPIVFTRRTITAPARSLSSSTAASTSAVSSPLGERN